MRTPAWLLLFASSAFVSAQSTTTDEQTASAWEENGTRAYYFANFGKQGSLSETCVKYCEKENDHGYAQCDVAAYKDIDLENDKSNMVLLDQVR